MKENKEIHEDPKQMSGVLNKNFQKLFTTECYFQKPQGQEKQWDVVNQD